jgi:hypothetical protein
VKGIYILRSIQCSLLFQPRKSDELSEKNNRDQVKEIFDPIVQQIEELLAEQRRNIKDLGLSTKVSNQQ